MPRPIAQAVGIPVRQVNVQLPLSITGNVKVFPSLDAYHNWLHNPEKYYLTYPITPGTYTVNLEVRVPGYDLSIPDQYYVGYLHTTQQHHAGKQIDYRAWVLPLDCCTEPTLTSFGK